MEEERACKVNFLDFCFRFLLVIVGSVVRFFVYTPSINRVNQS